MGSSRLPGKVLKRIDNIPLLKIQIERIKKVSFPHKLIIATTTKKEDNSIYEFCIENEINCFRGSENDVLSRYYLCALEYKLKTIIRITGDCPLIDPLVIDKVTEAFFEQGVDYCSNTVPPELSKWPDGSDVEVFTIKALTEANKFSSKASEREHVTFYFWRNKESKFRIFQVDNDEDWSNYRFTIDYLEDFHVIEHIFREIKLRNIFGHVDEVIEILKSNRSIRSMNSNYKFGEGWDL